MNTYASNFYIGSLARLSSERLVAVLRVLVLLLALLINAALSIDSITNSNGLIAYSLLLLAYLYVEAKNLWTRDAHLFWANPVVLASIFTFAMAFGFTNVLFFMPEDVVALVGLEPIATPWMNQLMLLVVLAACAMWVGYSSGVGRSIGRILQGRVLRRWMKVSGHVNMPVLFAFLAISLLARLWAIRLGLFGYSSSYNQAIAGANYSEYIWMGASVGALALASLAMECFAPARFALSQRLLLWIVLGYEVVFGFLAGFKSAVIMPFIIVGIVYYSQRNRFPRWLIPAVAVGLMAAFAVIEPFRAARNTDAGFVGTSLGSIVATMTDGNRINADDGRERSSTGLTVLARMNLTYVASLGIEYAANNDELPEGSPEFLGNIFLAPVHAAIPRLLWPNKPLQTTGLWYTNQVVGLDLFSSTGMSPFTYLNFAGGPFAVILGFLIVGILQRGLFDGLRQSGGGGLIVLFGLLGTLANIDSSFNAFFISIIRLLPILVIGQYVLLQRSRG